MRSYAMEGDIKHLRVRFSGAGHGIGVTIPGPSQESTGYGRGLVSGADQYDTEYAAMVAAVAYAIAAQEERSVSQEKPIADKFGSERKPVAEKLAPGPGSRKQSASSIDAPRATLPKRGESLKRPIEGSKSSKWFSGKEHIDDDYNDGPGANVSVRKPLGPTQKKPEAVIPDGKVEGKLLADSAPSNFPKAPEKKLSRKFEPEQGNEVGSRSNRESAIPTPGMASSSEAQMMADAWEKEKLAKIKKQYNETMETIAEWEAEKKAKAKRQKELKSESDSERKRAKALEEYNEEMSRINKVATASRLTAEEKRRNAERKVREKAYMIRSTGKLPRTCGCF